MSFLVSSLLNTPKSGAVAKTERVSIGVVGATAMTPIRGGKRLLDAVVLTAQDWVDDYCAIDAWVGKQQLGTELNAQQLAHLENLGPREQKKWLDVHYGVHDTVRIHSAFGEAMIKNGVSPEHVAGYRAMLASIKGSVEHEPDAAGKLGSMASLLALESGKANANKVVTPPVLPKHVKKALNGKGKSESKPAPKGKSGRKPEVIRVEDAPAEALDRLAARAQKMSEAEKAAFVAKVKSLPEERKESLKLLAAAFA